MTQALPHTGPRSTNPALAAPHSTSSRSRQTCTPTRMQPLRATRRGLGFGALTAALSLVVAEEPAHALFGLGGDPSQAYTSETTDLLTTVKNVVSLEREDPQREADVTRVRGMTNQWVARYRRDDRFAGRPSFSNTYSVVNALAGHFNSFGTEAPLPKKRLERLLKEVDDAERFLSRGR